MKKNSAFPSNFMKKEDAESPFVALIDHLEMEEINGDSGKEQKAVLHFQGDDHKPMILNSGNWDTIAEAYGDDSDDWAGCKIELYVDPSVKYAGKKVGGLRVRIPATNKSPSEAWKTIDEAAAALDISRETIAANLKAMGITAWNPQKCSAIVKEMVEQTAEIPF